MLAYINTMEQPNDIQGKTCEINISHPISECNFTISFIWMAVSLSAVSDTVTQIIEIVNYVVLCSLVSAFGIVTNIINLGVFLKQGLDTTINISFFALAISDLSSLILQQWFSVCVNPLFQRADIIVEPSEVVYITGGLPRATFGRITFLVTVYITAERCLCVAFPLHIKQMISPRRTAGIISAIFIVSISFPGPVYHANHIGWKVYPELNKTLLGHLPRENKHLVESVVYALHSFIGIISFAAVVVFTGILIFKLQRKMNWRNLANMNIKQSESMSSRETQTMNLVVLIAGILIICNIPGVVLSMATFFESELSAGGRYSKLFFVSWSFGFLLESINSSVNIFLYYKMSSKYRDTFHKLFSVSCVFKSFTLKRFNVRRITSPSVKVVCWHT